MNEDNIIKHSILEDSKSSGLTPRQQKIIFKKIIKEINKKAS